MPQPEWEELERRVARLEKLMGLAESPAPSLALPAPGEATASPLVNPGKLPSILGTPAAGETANGKAFDGSTEVATFPGDLPADPDALFSGADSFHGLASTAAERSDFRFLRFRPPLLERDADGDPALPHIRLDRALQFLIGDRLQ